MLLERYISSTYTRTQKLSKRDRHGKKRSGSGETINWAHTKNLPLAYARAIHRHSYYFWSVKIWLGCLRGETAEALKISTRIFQKIAMTSLAPPDWRDCPPVSSRQAARFYHSHKSKIHDSVYSLPVIWLNGCGAEWWRTFKRTAKHDSLSSSDRLTFPQCLSAYPLIASTWVRCRNHADVDDIYRALQPPADIANFRPFLRDLAQLLAGSPHWSTQSALVLTT